MATRLPFIKQRTFIPQLGPGSLVPFLSYFTPEELAQISRVAQTERKQVSDMPITLRGSINVPSYFIVWIMIVVAIKIHKINLPHLILIYTPHPF